MSENTISARLKLAAKTEQEWSTLNPQLKKGEIAISTDQDNNFKIGDGVNNWNDLSYKTYKTSQLINDAGYISSTELIDDNKFKHTITIGDKTYDGTQNIVIEVYDGTVEDEELLNNVQLMSNILEAEIEDNNLQTMTLIEETNNVNNMTLVENNSYTSGNMTLVSNNSEEQMQIQDSVYYMDILE